MQNKVRSIRCKHGCKESVLIADSLRRAAAGCPEVDKALDLLLGEIVYILLIDHPKGSIEHVLVSDKR